MKTTELRYNPINLRVVSSEDNVDSRTITGTAIVFNSRSELLNEQGIRFYETIAPTAITQELIDESDIVMLYNHKKDAGVLARSKKGAGSLKIGISGEGVDFSFEAPNSPLGETILESVKRGDLDACSFAFGISEGGDKWQKEDKHYLRTINKINLLTDFSIVVNPAYTATQCNSRGLDELIEAEKLDIEAIALKQRSLDEYYTNLKNIINSI